MSWLVFCVGLFLGYCFSSLVEKQHHVAGYPPVSERSSQGSSPTVVVALVSALFYGALWPLKGETGSFLWSALLGAFLILVAVIDLRFRVIPDKIIYPATIIAVAGNLTIGQPEWSLMVLGGLFGLGLFLLTAILRPGGLGGGDVKLATFIGLAVGFPRVLWALGLGILLAGVLSIFLIMTGQATKEYKIPYAPFLCTGALIALVFDPWPFLLSVFGPMVP